MFVPEMAGALLINDTDLNRAASTLKAVAHPTRLKIVCLLGKDKKLSVTELSERTGCEQSLVSHHLNNMRSKGIVEIEREGKNIFYSLADRKILNVVKCLD
jgi:DNA-binding transcriptional ArsR family regulator